MGIEISRLNLAHRMPDEFVGFEGCLISIPENLTDFRFEVWVFKGLYNFGFSVGIVLGRPTPAGRLLRWWHGAIVTGWGPPLN